MVFSFIRNLLQAEPETLDPSLEQDDPGQVAFCILLLESAAEDGTFSAVERQRVAQILADKFHLSSDDVDRLIAQTRKARRDAVDLWEFTHNLNETLSVDEKKSVMRSVWRVVYADGVLAHAEDRLAHRFGKLLRLPHKDVIDAKLTAKREMESS